MSQAAGAVSETAIASRARVRRPPLLDAMVIPAAVVLVAVVLYPTVRAIILSAYHDELLDPTATRLIGNGNYARLLHDTVFWTAAKNTMVFTLASVAVGFALGLGLAVLTDRVPPALRFVRGALLTPWAIPVIVVAFLFRYMLDQQVGIVNFLLVHLRLLPAPVPWVASPRWSMAAVVSANVWSQTPFFLLMFMAALKGIPDEVRDAVRIDGAGHGQEFWHITVPYLQNAMVVSSLLMVIANFNNFPLIWAMTGGGPVYTTTTLVVYIYQLAFAQFNLGYAAAVGTVWLLVLLGLAILYIRVLGRKPLEAIGET
jgi:ABC-type sugar transport system permease subunit